MLDQHQKVSDHVSRKQLNNGENTTSQKSVQKNTSAHPIKEGLAEPDTELDFKYKVKFISLSNTNYAK